MVVAMLLAALAAQVPPDPFGDRWQLMGEDGDAFYAIDPASIAREGDQARVAIRARAKDDNDDVMRIVVTRSRFDCVQRLTGMEAAQAYDAGGTRIRDMEIPSDQVRLDRFTDLPTQAIFAAVCGAN